MEDGGVDTTVIVSQQHKTDQMADNSLLLASVVYKNKLMNLVNTTLFKKFVKP